MREKWKRARQIYKAVLHYLTAILFAVIFALFCSGRVGWFLVLMLLLAPVMSVLYSLPFAHGIEVEVSGSEDLLTKGECCRLSVRIRNKYCLPTPPVKVEFFGCPGLVCSQETMYLSVLPFQTAWCEAVYTAKLAGSSSIGVKKLSVQDLTNLFCFAVSKKVFAGESRRVGVLPEVAEIPSDAEYLRVLSQAAAGREQSEETTEASGHTFGGFPGYEHRIYQPGDPVKRINWKLSAGRKDLYVRLDEMRVGAGVAVVLDPYLCENVADRLTAEEKKQIPGADAAKDSALMRCFLQQETLEQALGFVQSLIRSELAVKFYYRKIADWKCLPVTDEGGVEALIRELAEYYFVDRADDNRIPQEIPDGQSGCSAMLYCTPLRDAFAVEHVPQLFGKQDDFAVSVYVAASQSGEVL